MCIATAKGGGGENMPDILRFILIWGHGLGIGFALSSLMISSSKKHHK